MKKQFDYFQPTKIKFGAGRIEEIGDCVAEFGKKCVLATVPLFDKKLNKAIDGAAAEKSYPLVNNFLKNISMASKLKDLGVSSGDLGEIAERSMELPDYTYNPRVLDLDEIIDLLQKSY